MSLSPQDRRWLAAALALSERGRGSAAPNPNVGCVIVADGRVAGRGWTQAGGRPHAEAMALEQAGALAAGATVYVTLEPCAHEGPRGPACAALLADARPGRVVIAARDPDPRTDGAGAQRLRQAGIEVVENADPAGARAAMPGFFSRIERGRPHITLKLATSLDGRIALPSGESRWITGPAARAHAHLERARADAVLVGRGTYEADLPRLDVRLAGLEQRSPRRLILSQTVPDEPGWERIGAPRDVADRMGIDHLLVEGGAATAAGFLSAGLVDRLVLYRAPILLGDGRPALDAIGLARLADAHGRWRLTETRMLGMDRLEVYAAA